MATKNPRLNIVLEPELMTSVSHLAKRQGVSLSTAARDLIKEALETYEDIHWSKAAQKREASLNAKKTLTHQDIWG